MDEPTATDDLNFQRSGSGQPLVLLHGIGSELCVWEPVLQRLSAERDVIAVDLPGFGHSEPLPDDIAPSPAALAQSVTAFADRLGLGSVHVAGNSLGGWVALEMAKVNGARSVTCLSPAGLWERPLTRATVPTRSKARRAARALRPLLPLLMRSTRLRRLALMNFVAHADRVPPSAAERMVSSYGRATAYEATSLAMRSSALVGAETIEVPVTVAWGERDRLVRKAPLPAPLARSLVLADCGHVPMWDAPDLVADVLLEGSARSV